MSFVKLDCGILDSTLWSDRLAKEMFITALLMAEPFELREEQRQIRVRTLEETGFVVPVGWYGLVRAAGIGIVRRAGLEVEEGLSALERLGNPEMESRTPSFEGRRLVRIAGGYIALNYNLYREKDHTSAERSKRYRENKMKKKGRRSNRIPSDYKDGERRFVKAFENGDSKQCDQIAAEAGERILEERNAHELPC